MINGNDIRAAKAAVATIGFFDGVHSGHRFLIEQVKAEAVRRGLQSLLITFGDHPLRVIRPDFEPRLLTTRDEKLKMLADTGVDSIATLDFTHEMSLMSARDFMEKMLLHTYNVRALVIGHDHHFGHNRAEGFDDYARYGRELGIDVVQAEALKTQNTNLGTPIIPSSTFIRTSLQQGDIATANAVLGYAYSIEGTVVSGFQNGRKLGYPTANLAVAKDKLVPTSGVYLVQVEGMGYGMLNIGTRPTLDNGNDQSIEVHIFDFDGELYSRTLRVSFLCFIRHEQRFDSLEHLQHQLDNDAAKCRSLLNCH